MKSPDMQKQGRYSRLFLVAGAIAACAILLLFSTQTARAGGVKRRLTVITDPPGAKVYIDGYEIGITPISTYFTYYGTRKVRIVREGYETLTVDELLPAPWYEYPGVDFFVENFSRSEIDHHLTLSYKLEPRQVVIQDHLIQRAEQFRLESLAQAGVAPPPNPIETVPRATLPPDDRSNPPRSGPPYTPYPPSAPSRGTLPPGVSTGSTQPRYPSPQETASNWTPQWATPNGVPSRPRIPGIGTNPPRVAVTPPPAPNYAAPQPGVVPATAEIPTYSPTATPARPYDAPFLR
jgi:hypothetical protein